MQRVMIIGQPGSGKSTLARKLGAHTGLPVIHIDKEVHWKPGWIERPSAEKSALCAEIHARPQWIFEGGHSRTWPERLARADTLIWLDLPLRLRLWRVFYRTCRDYGRSRADLPENCPERFDPDFWRWIWNTRHTGKESAAHLFQSAPSHKTKHHLTSRRAVQRFLTSLTG